MDVRSHGNALPSSQTELTATGILFNGKNKMQHILVSHTVKYEIRLIVATLHRAVRGGQGARGLEFKG